MSTGHPRHNDVNESEQESGGGILRSILPAPDEADSVTLGTCGRFLLGHRKAIEQIASTPGATWLALSCVLLAAFFRDYDQADLLRVPGWLIVPFIASTTLGSVLFVLLKLIPHGDVHGVSDREQYRRLLTCFWMTAPLAAIYAVPVERFFSPGEATQWNLNFLFVVATWRVLLITRVIQVLYDLSFIRSLWPAMLLADSLALVVMVLIPIPILQVMGGIQLSESSEIINGARALVILLGAATWPIWFVGFASSIFRSSSAETEICLSQTRGAVQRGPWIAVGLASVLMFVACCFTQPEQQRAETFRRRLLAGEVESAISYLSRLTPDQLPPHWDPPPRIDYQERTPNLFSVLDGIASDPSTPAWINSIYTDKLLQKRGRLLGLQNFWNRITEQELRSLLNFLKTSPSALQAFDRGSLERGYYWDDEGSIRCTVLKLIRDDFRFWGSPDVIPHDLVQELLELDDSKNSRGCGTKEEVQAALLKKIQPPVTENSSSERQSDEVRSTADPVK